MGFVNDNQIPFAVDDGVDARLIVGIHHVVCPADIVIHWQEMRAGHQRSRSCFSPATSHNAGNSRYSSGFRHLCDFALGNPL